MPCQNTGNVDGIQLPLFKTFGNDLACFQLIGTLHFFRSQIPCAGNGSVNVIRMGGAIGRNVPAGLRPNGGPAGVGVHNPADGGKTAVQLRMGRGVRGRIQIAFNLVSIGNGYHHHIFRLQLLIGNAAGFDHKQALFPIHPGNVAPGEGNQMIGRQKHVGFINLLFQCFKHGTSFQSFSMATPMTISVPAMTPYNRVFSMEDLSSANSMRIISATPTR